MARKQVKLTKPTRRNMRGSMGMPGASKHVRHAHAMVSPFSADARGSKIPDDDSSRSVAITVKDIYQLDVDSSGQAAVHIRPNLSSMYRKATVFAGYTVTTWGAGTAVTDYSTLQSSFSSYRIVSWGVKIIDTDPLNTTQGMIRVITVPADPADGFSYGSSLYEEVDDYSKVQCDIHWVSRPKGVDWKSYVAINTFQHWDGVVIGVSGAGGTTNKLRIEVVVNLECQIALGQVTGAIATPAADHSPLALSAADHVRNRTRHSGTTRSFLGSLWDATKSAIVSAAQAYGTPLAGAAARRLLGVPSRPSITGPVLEVD